MRRINTCQGTHIITTLSRKCNKKGVNNSTNNYIYIYCMKTGRFQVFRNRCRMSGEET